MSSVSYINSILSKYQNIPSSIIQTIDSQLAPYKDISYENVPYDIKEKIVNEVTPYINADTINEQIAPYTDKINSTISNIQIVQQQIESVLSKATTLETSINSQLTSLLQYVKSILSGVVDILTNHLGLISADTKDLATQILKLLISSSIAVFAGIFALLLFSLLAVVIFWNTNRVLAFSVVIGIFVTITAVAIFFAMKTSKQMPLLFGQLIAQLKKDKIFLQNYF